MYHARQATASSTATETPARSITPEDDVIQPVQRLNANPFATPYGSSPASRNASSTALHLIDQPRYFHSRRVKKGSVERPWMDRKDPKEKWVTIIPLVGIFVGLALSGVLIWDGLRSVVNHNYCEILSEDFSNGLNSKIWTKEVEVGGFG
jgi:hypothetical protein